MENQPLDLETKYQKLATEYSKIRSQAAVLKKAVLDEQAKNLELKDIIKKHEQTIRKHDQEMESLTFRNEQLTKRILVLQQELQINVTGKKNKSKNCDNSLQSVNVVDEELQKKIVENAQLVSLLADKDYEVNDNKEKLQLFKSTIETLEKELNTKEALCSKELEKYKKKNNALQEKIKHLEEENYHKNSDSEGISTWKTEAERWKTECKIVKSRPSCNDDLVNYYELQLSDIIKAKEISTSYVRTLSRENKVLQSILENAITSNKQLNSDLEKSNEELLTTIVNYKSQLDAMTEHLAAQNDKITRQCDEIQDLKMKLTIKK